jgi:hypothetical protein
VIDFLGRLLVLQQREPIHRPRHGPSVSPDAGRRIGGRRRVRPFIRARDELGAYGILLDIAENAIDRRLVRRQNGAITALEDGAAPCRASTGVETTGQHRAEPVHEARQVAVGPRPDDKVVVIRHHAARQNPHVEFRARLLERALEDPELGAARDERLSLRGPVHHVNDLPACCSPRWPRHEHPSDTGGPSSAGRHVSRRVPRFDRGNEPARQPPATAACASACAVKSALPSGRSRTWHAPATTDVSARRLE